MESASVAPMNNFFTCFASASISLLGLVCTTTVYISGCSASLVSLGRFLDALQKVCPCSPHQLNFGPFHTSPLHKGFGNNLCHSIGHKLFVVPLTGNPIPRHCSLCPSIHRPHYIKSFQSASYIVYIVGCLVSRNELQPCDDKPFLP